MRGQDSRSGSLFSYVDLEQRVRSDHPLRTIRTLVNEALASLDGRFGEIYSEIGRPSIPPEQLLRAMLLQAFCSVLRENRPEEWLLVEWPEDEEQPTKYWLSTLPESISFADLVDATKLRWRIERDYQDLKQKVGLGHYEGRGWRCFHHHATLCIAAYGFLICERGAFSPSGWPAARKLQQAVVSPRGRPSPATPSSGTACDQLDRHHATEAHRRPRQDAQPLPMLPHAAA